jgi:hypothetical protein
METDMITPAYCMLVTLVAAATITMEMLASRAQTYEPPYQHRIHGSSARWVRTHGIYGSSRWVRTHRAQNLQYWEVPHREYWEECTFEVQSTGRSRHRVSNAENEAVESWQRDVTATYGSLFADYKWAKSDVRRCVPAEKTMFGQKTACTITAVPCKAPPQPATQP